MRKRKKKRYIACNVPKTGEKDFDSVVRRLKEEAGRRAEEIIRRQQRNAEEKDNGDWRR